MYALGMFRRLRKLYGTNMALLLALVAAGCMHGPQTGGVVAFWPIAQSRSAPALIRHANGKGVTYDGQKLVALRQGYAECSADDMLLGPLL